MTGSVVNVSGYFAFGRPVAAGGNARRLLGGAGATLQALDDGRGDLECIKAALT